MTWHKIASSAAELSFGDNNLTEVTVAGKTICVAVNKDHIHACARKCPHAGGHLSEGFLDAMGNIVCPIHRYRFNLTNGRNTSGEGYYLKTFPVETRDDGIYVGLEEGGLLGWLK